MRQAWVRAAAMLLVVLPAASMAAATIGVVTIVEGEAMLVRGDERFAVVEGLKLRAEDIVGSADGARLVRLELDDGNVVDLGPATQVLLQPRAIAGDRAAVLYAAQGWVKLSNTGKAPAAMASARLDVQRISGNAILRVGKDDLWLFAETGAADAVKRRDGKAGASSALKDGDSFVQRGGVPGSVSRLPPAELLKQLPRAFVDTLPRRAARYADGGVEPARAVEVGYADVALWVNGEPALRAAFVPRLTQRAKEPRFRSALVAELKLHPEWQRVLFPPPPPPPDAPRPVQGPELPASATERTD